MRIRSIFALAAVALFPLQAGFADDVNITPGGGDYLVGRPLSVTAERSIDPEPEGFCGCDADNNPTDWVFTHDSISLYGDADSGGNVDTESTGTKNVYAHVTYHWNCPADSSTKETEGQDDAQAPFHIYNAGMEGPDVLDLETDGTFNAKKMPDDVAVSGDWEAEGGTPGNNSGSSFTTKWLEPGEWGISVTIEGVEFSRTVKVKPPEIKVTAVTFMSDHGLIRDNSTTWAPTGNAVIGPEWTPQQNFPITHTMGEKTKAMIKVSILPVTLSSRSYQITGEGPAGLNFSKQVDLAGGENQLVEVESLDAFASKIHKVEASIYWKIEAQGISGYTETGPHRVYVLFGPPIQNMTSFGTLRQECVVTEKRVATVVGYCDQYGSKSECAWKLWSTMGWMSYESDDPNGPDNIWDLYSGATAQCTGLARFLNAHMMMLGFQGALRFCKPKANGSFVAELNTSADSRLVSVTTGHPSGTGHGVTTQGSEELRFFDALPSKFAHKFVASVLFETVLYAPSVVYSNSARTLVEAISQNGIHWCHNYNSSNVQKCPHVPWAAQP